MNCGIIELLVEAGVSTEGTMRAAMKGEDTKEGTKNEYITSNVEEAGSVSLEKLIIKACTELNPESLKELLTHPQMKPLKNLQVDMSKWIESFIEMVNIRLNIIHFQKIGNWQGYLQAVHEFLP